MIALKKTESIELQGNIGEQTFQLVEAANLAWKVTKEPLFTGNGIRTESFGIIRSDNEQWLGTVGRQYEVMQNWDLAEIIVKAADGISSQFRGGYIGGGEKTFIQVALADEKIERDTVKRFITALNSHDGSTSIGFGSSNTVVVCQNTFYRAYREVQKFRHGLSAAIRISAADEDLRKAVQNDVELMTSYKRMAETKIEKPIFERIVKTLFNEELNVSPVEISTRKKNQMQEFNTVVEKELASHGETLWGLFNAVTYYENHIVSAKKNSEEKAMIGGGFRKMNASYDTIMTWIEERSYEYVEVK